MQPRRSAILALLAVTQLIGVLDFSIVNVALPSIEKQFDLAADRLQWVVSAYALTLGGFLLLGGRMADLLDRKLVFMLGVSVFAAASVAGGLAPTASLVFVVRAVQGLGGAVLAPTALALLTAEFAGGDERNRALSVFGTVAALGFTAGVILAGALTGFVGGARSSSSMFRSRWLRSSQLAVCCSLSAGRALGPTSTWPERFS